MPIRSKKTTETLKTTEITEIREKISVLSGSQCYQWLNLLV